MNRFDQFHPEVLEKLQAAVNGNVPARYPDLKKYIGTSHEFIGLSVPVQRRVYKEGYTFSTKSTGDKKDIWNDIWTHSPWFESLSQALFFLKTVRDEEDAESLWALTKPWVTRIDNWAHSDELSGMYAYLLEKLPGRVYEQFQTWNKSKNPWERRQSVVGLIEYGKKRQKVLPVTKLLGMVKPLLEDDNYFVQKGVGWTLREIGGFYPEKTEKFLEDHIKQISPAAFGPATEKLDIKTKEHLKKKRKSK